MWKNMSINSKTSHIKSTAVIEIFNFRNKSGPTEKKHVFDDSPITHLDNIFQETI